MRLPPLPTLDQADRRIVGIGLVVVLALLILAAALGLSVRVFLLASGLGG